MLFFDGTGLCLFYKRLDQGTFRLPDAADGQKTVEIEEGALEDLLELLKSEGIDIERDSRELLFDQEHPDVNRQILATLVEIRDMIDERLPAA